MLLESYFSVSGKLLSSDERIGSALAILEFIASVICTPSNSSLSKVIAIYCASFSSGASANWFVPGSWILLNAFLYSVLSLSLHMLMSVCIYLLSLASASTLTSCLICLRYS